MRVGAIGGMSGVALIPPSRLERLANWVTSQIGDARRNGKDEVTFFLDNNEVTKQLLERFQKHYKIEVEKTNSMRVSIKL